MITNSRLRKSRKGVAVTEAAFCIPVILILIFGSLEVCNVIFVKERVSICAYEGCRVGVKRRATRQQAFDASKQLMNSFGYSDSQFTVTVTPDDFSTLEALDPISVSISYPLTGTASLFGSIINQTTVTSTVQMVREFDD
jgi:hypothetical protein